MVAVKDVIMLQNLESSPTHSFVGHIDVVFVHMGLCKAEEHSFH